MRLKLLLDENIPPDIAKFVLEKRPEWDILHVENVGLCGQPDKRMFECAQRGGYVILSFDADFADHTIFPLGSHCGIIRLRVHPPTKRQARAALDRLLSAVTDEQIINSLIIVDHEKFRIRRLSRDDVS